MYGLSIVQKDDAEEPVVTEGLIKINRVVISKAPKSCMWGFNMLAYQIKNGFKGKIEVVINPEYTLIIDQS